IFLLPSVLARKSEAEIASKKRAEYRRRYALLDSVVEQVPATFKR
ncbi:Putative virK protein, partial [Salmonella enterica subsp. enterica serovar Mississippi str. A4-633]